MKRIRKIALEEHYMAPGFEESSKVFLKHITATRQANLHKRLTDFDEIRLMEMDQAGIDLAILSQSCPRVQAEKETAKAISRVQKNNDFLAQQVTRHPTRYAGFTTWPMHDPIAAVDELERTIKTLQFKGSLINGHTNGVYYDDRSYDPFLERMQDLDVPMYLHPTDAFVQMHALTDHPELVGAIWGWGVETAAHAPRILFSLGPNNEAGGSRTTACHIDPLRNCTVLS